jgi:SAM-dependent methyltransferase
MRYTKRQINDLQKIMSIEKEMIPLLSLFKPKNRILNPWEKEFPKIFKKLRLKKGMTVMDIPCGQGGVSVPLAKKYKVNVIGYDILPAYVRYAREYAKEKKGTPLCRFKVRDIRDAVKRKNICDVLLWVAPPHVWGRAKPTISKLRNAVRSGGIIVVADAYLYQGVRRKGMYKDYENLKNTTKGYASFGDEIIKVYDYKGSLWDFDYSRTRREIVRGVKRAKTEKDRNIVKKYLASLDDIQNEETKDLGLAIWVIKINK